MTEFDLTNPLEKELLDKLNNDNEIKVTISALAKLYQKVFVRKIVLITLYIALTIAFLPISILYLLDPEKNIVIPVIILVIAIAGLFIHGIRIDSVSNKKLKSMTRYNRYLFIKYTDNLLCKIDLHVNPNYSFRECHILLKKSKIGYIYSGSSIGNTMFVMFIQVDINSAQVVVRHYIADI